MRRGLFFFFKQKTAYEMRISDWSSDVCSSDLENETPEHHQKSLDLQIAIMCAMADELDYDITPESLRSGAYISKGFADRETLILKIGKASCRERVCQYV